MTPVAPPTDDELRAAIAEMMPRIRRDLESLARIPSIALEGFDRRHVRDAAEAIVRLFAEMGHDQARLVEIPDGAPMVYLDIPAPEGAPTVLLYAHYDVQPPGDESQWTSPPFEPTLRGGRLHGRGVADDKSSVVAHLAVLRAYGERLPVGVRVILEGEEETESHLGAFLSSHPEMAAADVLVIADLGNIRLGQPNLTTSVRGLVTCTVDVRTLAHPVHSGMFGGPAPDALLVLIKLLSTLVDDAGNTVIDGLPATPPWDGPEFPEDVFRTAAGVLDGVPLTGTDSIAARVWAKPAVCVTGLDARPTAGAAAALQPHARAIVSLRVPPTLDGETARAALANHLRTRSPWGVLVDVVPGEAGSGTAVHSDGPAYAAARDALRAAFGHEEHHIGQGGAVPLVAQLHTIAPDAEILMIGAQDPEAFIHAIDESVDLTELQSFITGEAFLLSRLAALGRAAS